MFKNLSIQAKVAIGSAVAALTTGILTLVSSAQVVPTVGTTDIASVGGAILAPLITGGEYLMVTFGPPLLYFGLVVLVFMTIKHYVGRRKPKL